MTNIGNSGANLDATFHLVRDELISTIEGAESCFARYIDKQMDIGELQKSIDDLIQINGTFRMLEVQGGGLLLSEMLSLANQFREKNIDENNSALGVFSSALFTLSRYVEYLEVKRRDVPELLLSIINDLRAANGSVRLPDAYFFSVNLRAKVPETGAGNAPHLIDNIRRIRHMYQLGLLSVLKGENAKAGVKVMSRSIYHLEKNSRQTASWPFWWVANAALEAMVDNSYEVSVGRKRLLAQLDRLLRKVLVTGAPALSEKQPDGLFKDLLLLVSLADEKSLQVSEVQKAFYIDDCITESELNKEADSLNGPNVAAIKSVASALQDEVSNIKEALDLASRNEGKNTNYNEMNNSISRVADTLMMIDQVIMARPIKALVPIVEHWNGMAQVTPEDFLKVADVMLSLEGQIASMTKVSRGEDEPEIIGANHFNEAKIVLVAESESGISLSKRAIGAYIDSDFDKMHLGNISKTLDAVRGGLIFLGEDRACALIVCGLQFINDKLVNADELPKESELEILADALSSVEYYLETMAGSKELASEVIEVAAVSMAQLGYKI
jgi:hypothetical protein